LTITYFDTSALVKLFLVDEGGSSRAQALWRDADERVSVNLIEVEARATFAAAHRAARLSETQSRLAVVGLRVLMEGLTAVTPSDQLVGLAGDLADSEGLRGYDAVHLATALAVRTEVFVCADTRLCAAASAQGLAVANPLVT